MTTTMPDPGRRRDDGTPDPRTKPARVVTLDHRAQSHRATRRRNPLAVTVFALLGVLTLIASACTVEPPPNGEPPLAKISSFTATATSGSSSDTVTLAWKIKHLGSATALCRIESDGDGFTPIEIEPCAVEGSTMVTVATDPAPRTETFTLTVEISLGYVLTETASFTVAPVIEDPFDITFTGLEDLSTQVSNALLQAAARWESVITTGFPTVSQFPSWCQDPDDYELPESVDDLLIYVIIKEMDGVGGALAAAGPSCILIQGERAVTGVIYLDQDDLATMNPAKLTRVAIHEIGHVLGIGTLWNNDGWGQRHLLDDKGGTDPRYTGSNAVAEWNLLGGSGNVPVENTGPDGTRDSHWRESVFATEIMTGWLDSVTPMSRMTIASLADMGYVVDLDAADPYSLPSPIAALHGDGFGALRATDQTNGQGTGPATDDVDTSRFAPRPLTPPIG